MKPFWKILVAMAIPLLISAGEAKRNEDANETGKDDATGEALIFSGNLLKALVNDKPLPKAPPILQ